MTDRRTGVVLLVLSGILFLAALSAYAVHTYFESATFCGGLIQADIYPPEPDCGRFLDPRRRVVFVVAAAGAVLLAVGLLVSRLGRRFRPEPTSGPWVRGWAIAGWSALSLLGPIGFYIGLYSLTAWEPTSAYFGDETGLPEGWIHLSPPLCALLIAWGATRSQLSRESAMAGAALAIPAMTVIQFLLLFDREGPPPVDELGVHLLLGIPLCLALIVVTRLRNKGFTAPRLAVSGALIVLSACITTIVYIPQILPGWRTAIGGRETPQGGFPAPVWMSLLIAMLVVSLIAVALTYVRRPEALGVPVEHEGHQ